MRFLFLLVVPVFIASQIAFARTAYYVRLNGTFVTHECQVGEGQILRLMRSTDSMVWLATVAPLVGGTTCTPDREIRISIDDLQGLLNSF